MRTSFSSFQSINIFITYENMLWLCRRERHLSSWNKSSILYMPKDGFFFLLILKPFFLKNVFWSYRVFSSNLWKQFGINLYHYLCEFFRLCCPCGAYVVLDSVIWQTICRIHLHTLKCQPWSDWPQFVCRSVSFVSHNCFLL